MQMLRRAVLAAAAFLSMSAASAQLTQLTGAVSVHVGYQRACALLDTGAVKCWGVGPLGDGTGATRYTAGNVDGLGSGVVALGLSNGNGRQNFGHNCAVMASGGVKCWGANESGQLGDGTTTMQTSPVDVVGLPGPAVAVAAGEFHTCALLASGGVHCWGSNVHGQLGGNSLTSGIVAITAAARHSCALTNGGGVKCWGANERGQLGDGTTTDRSTPVDVQSLGSGVAAISAGGAWNYVLSGQPGSYTCALTTTGGAKCWGANNFGQLGDGTLSGHLTPFDVLGMTSGVAGISTGGMYSYVPGSGGMSYYALGLTCAVTTGGAARCWGVDHGGSLGNGQPGGMYPDSSPNPTNVLGLGSGVTAVAAGGAFGCALVAGGAVRCWGWGFDGTNDGFPQPVMSGTVPQSITVGPHPPIAIGAMAPLQATGGASGNPVTFTSLSPAICSISGTTVTGLAQGMCVVAANQAGNGNYDPAPQVTFDFRVGDPVAQTITFGAAPTVVVNGVGSVSATASSGLPVSFSSNTPSTCSVSGNLVTGLAQGSCTIAAAQPGDELYGPAPQVTQTFTVGPNAGTSILRLAVGGTGSGTVTSTPAGIDCGTTCGGNFPNGSTVTLTPSPGPDSFFDRWEGACTGTGGCTVSMTATRDVTAHFQSTIMRLANLATRMQVLTGDNVLIGGFIIQGSGPKTVVVRARGPSLAQFGVPGVLQDPLLQLFSGGTQIAFNDSHGLAPNAAQLAASGFAPDDPREAAILTTLNPGPYTAIVTGVGGTSGVAIVEVFEVDAVDVPLVNIATRGFVQTGDNVMIGGFILQGQGTQTVVVRARGPSLFAQGVPNTLANPTLQLFAGQNLIATNDDWQGAPNAVAIQSSGFAPPDNVESAIMMTLAPGAYSAIVSGVGGTTGVGIVEVFRVR